MSEEQPKLKKDHWFQEMMLAAGGAWFWLFLVPVALMAGILWRTLIVAETKANRSGVVVYTSQDQVYAEPILREFEQRTGIKVRALYDSEAVKTVGLANRLLAEKDHPQCDIFWSNEELRTRQLAAQGVFEKWAAVGFRSRRIAVNTNRLSLAAAPKSLSDLTNESWRGRVALAYPLFGTTATHFLVLRQQWGEQRWLAWCRALAANKPFLVDGNSVAAQLVARGEAWIGLTDSDDIAAEQREGAPIVPLPLDKESLIIPNTIALVRGAPRVSAAGKLFDYLQRPDVVEKLVSARALEGASHPDGDPPTLKPDWGKLLADLDSGSVSLKGAFLR